jgi:hypothetical protein
MRKTSLEQDVRHSKQKSYSEGFIVLLFGIFIMLGGDYFTLTSKIT